MCVHHPPHLFCDPFDASAHAPPTGRAAETNLVTYIVLIAVIGILLLHATGAIPFDSVGVAMVIEWR